MFSEVCFASVVLALSLAAVLLPYSESIPDSVVTTVFRHFGAGVIVATGFFHLLAPATEALEGVAGDFPLAIALCLVGVVLVLVVEISIHRKTSALYCGESTKVDGRAEIASLLILETGIIVHSIFIGLSLAIGKSCGLGIAVLFHQTFEGLGLGSRMNSLGVETKVVALLSGLFAIATPFGFALGCLVGSTENNLLTGVCDALAAGVTIYTGLVELVAGDMIYSSSFTNLPTGTCITSIGSLIGGMVAMGLLAIWI